MDTKSKSPEFVLYSESCEPTVTQQPQASTSKSAAAGSWRFVIRTAAGEPRLEASDNEPDVQDRERLALLAVVRGLEALQQPSHVKLVTSSRYVRRGLRFGLKYWRENNWQWERFGKMTPIKNGDLWKRVDRALRFHDVDCRYWRVDVPADDLSQTAVRPPHTRRRIAPLPQDSPVAGFSVKPANSRPLPSRPASTWQCLGNVIWPKRTNTRLAIATP